MHQDAIHNQLLPTSSGTQHMGASRPLFLQTSWADLIHKQVSTTTLDNRHASGHEPVYPRVPRITPNHNHSISIPNNACLSIDNLERDGKHTPHRIHQNAHGSHGTVSPQDAQSPDLWSCYDQYSDQGSQATLDTDSPWLENELRYFLNDSPMPGVYSVLQDDAGPDEAEYPAVSGPCR